MDHLRLRPFLPAILCVVVTVVLVGAMHLHAPHLNGPSYWYWNWRMLPVVRSYVPLFIAALPTAGALWVYRRRPERVWTAVRLVMLSTVLMCLVAGSSGTLDWDDNATQVILNPSSHGYFSDSFDSFVRNGSVPVRRFLREYPDRMPQFTIHGRNKPPGAVLFHLFWLRLLPRRAAAASAAALAIVALTPLGVAATFAMIRRVTGSADAALYGAVAMSLCPGLLLFTPTFDSIYPVFACALAWLWFEALQGSAWWAAAFGAAVAAVTFQTYNLLPMGIFFVAMAGREGWSGRGLRPTIIAAAVAVIAFGAAELLIDVVTGLSPVRTFRTALTTQAAMFANVGVMRRRDTYWSIPWDLADLALGMAWIPLIPLAGYLVRRGHPPRERAFAIAAVVLPLTIAVLRLMPGEDARVWVFMMPLLMLPVARELARWRPGGRFVFFACEWVLLATVFRTMYLHS